MYCVKCGVKLSDTEKSCPLCGTSVYHPDIERPTPPPLYPAGRSPKLKPNSKAVSGALLILFIIPIIISYIADIKTDGRLGFFGYVAGAVLLGYITFALPLWFKKPNPIVFTPCVFAGTAVYLWYISFATGGKWFFSLALPVTLGIAAIVCTVVTLLRCLKSGRLYVWGGALVALGCFVPIIELLICNTCSISYLGWSFYPLAALALLGGMLLFLAINKSAREAMERKLFF